MQWHPVNRNPPQLFEPRPYLVILNSNSRAQHAKRFAGLGTPEIAIYYKDWLGSGWSARGSLKVEFWMPLPEFDKIWVMGSEGELPKFI